MDNKYLGIVFLLLSLGFWFFTSNYNAENLGIIEDFYESERKLCSTQTYAIRHLRMMKHIKDENRLILERIIKIDTTLANADPFSTKQRSQIKPVLDSLNISYSNQECNDALLSLVIKNQLNQYPSSSVKRTPNGYSIAD